MMSSKGRSAGDSVLLGLLVLPGVPVVSFVVVLEAYFIAFSCLPCLDLPGLVIGQPG